MGADSLSQLCTSFNAAYGVNPDLNIHTGGCISFGYGMIHFRYRKQKLNTKSSTEARLVDVIDYLPYKIWIFCLWERKGMTLSRTFCSRIIIVQ